MIGMTSRLQYVGVRVRCPEATTRVKRRSYLYHITAPLRRTIKLSDPAGETRTPEHDSDIRKTRRLAPGSLERLW